MIISDLELFAIELPSADGPLRSLVMRLATDTGLEGWGETRKNWRPDELPARRGALLSVLAGREAFDVESILALDALADRAVACGVEMALWDVIARGARQPLCHLWGGSYRDRVPLSVRLPDGSPEASADWARAFAAQSIGSLSIGSRGSLDDDSKRIAAAREAGGGRVVLRFDARSRYDLHRAVQLCSELEAVGVQFVLDPLADADGELVSVLNARSRVRLGALSGVESPADVLRLSRAEAVSFVVVDPVRVGGILRARQCAVVAEAAGLAASVNIEGTSGLALAATLQLAAATPSFTSGHECSHPKLHDDILAEPLRAVDGMLVIPTAPGLGVEIDRDKIDRYSARA